jgi:hypothetical protein
VGKLPSLLAGIAAILAVTLQEAAAGDPVVSLGEVSVQAASRDDLDAEALRTMVADAVQSIDASTLPRGSHAVLSVSLVRLESRGSSPAEVSCLVSATLRDRSRGSVFAVLEGSARGQDEPRRIRALERAIMRAAVGSAVARVPEAMRRRRR